MKKLYSRPEAINKTASGFCPGCMHGTITKITAQVIDELGLGESAICCLPVGCGTLGLLYWNLDLVGCAHGRAPAVATGIKRSRPQNLVFTYQGDGDLGAIGIAEIIHAANRGENFTTIFVNNSIYGMTGGQMAPTTLIGQKSTTCSTGRDPALAGYPMNISELIATLKAPAFVARYAVNTPANINKAKAGIKKAFEIQLRNGGFTFIEILSNCPTNWGMTPLETLDFIKEQTMKQFPLGVFKEPEEGMDKC